jgi:hypothetical protein
MASPSSKPNKAEADRETIIRNFLSGQYSRPLRVVAFNVDEHWCREVSEDIAGEVLQRATVASHELPEATLAQLRRLAGCENPKRLIYHRWT